MRSSLSLQVIQDFGSSGNVSEGKFGALKDELPEGRWELLRVLESSSIGITNTAILILGTIHSKVLNGFISDEGWAALCAHTAFQLNLGRLASDEWQLQGAFHHVCVQDTHVEPAMSQIQSHNRQVCSPVSSYRCILSAEVIQSSLSFPTGQNSASKKGFVCFPMHFQLK